jgi:hypothetical protein
MQLQDAAGTTQARILVQLGNCLLLGQFKVDTLYLSMNHSIWPCQNVKAVFDTAIKVVLQPPRRREVMAARKKTRRSSGCSIR